MPSGLAALVVFALGATAPLRLAEVLAAVDARGPEQLALDAQIPIAQASVRSAAMFPNPTFTIGGGRAEPAFTTSLIFHLPITGQRGAAIRAAQGSVQQTTVEVAAGRWQLRRAARLAYYGVARADEAVTIALEIEELSRRIADMAREKYEVGSGTRLDERQAELVHMQAEQDVRDRRALAKAARLELARQLGTPADGPIADSLATIGETQPVDDLVEVALDHHPEVRALKEAHRAADLRRMSAKADLRPNFSFEAGLDLLDPVTCLSAHYCVGPRGIIGFDLPIFNWNRGPIDRATADARLADAKAVALKARIEAEVKTAYTSFSTALVRVRFYDDQYVPTATEMVQMAREGFALGRSGILSLIAAEQAVLQARLGRIDALYAVQAARADLEEASGVPLSAP